MMQEYKTLALKRNLVLSAYYAQKVPEIRLWNQYFIVCCSECVALNILCRESSVNLRRVLESKPRNITYELVERERSLQLMRN